MFVQVFVLPNVSAPAGPSVDLYTLFLKSCSRRLRAAKIHVFVRPEALPTARIASGGGRQTAAKICHRLDMGGGGRAWIFVEGSSLNGSVVFDGFVFLLCRDAAVGRARCVNGRSWERGCYATYFCRFSFSSKRLAAKPLAVETVMMRRDACVFCARLPIAAGRDATLTVLATLAGRDNGFRHQSIVESGQKHSDTAHRPRATNERTWLSSCIISYFPTLSLYSKT